MVVALNRLGCWPNVQMSHFSLLHIALTRPQWLGAVNVPNQLASTAFNLATWLAGTRTNAVRTGVGASSVPIYHRDVETKVTVATRDSDGLTSLTSREWEVLERAAEGMTNAEVAGDLGVTTHAVKFHLSSVFRKLNVKNRTEATSAYWRQAGERTTQP
jgi:DNA-binding NarL/FixJ family response regulator